MKVKIQFGTHKGRSLEYPDQHPARPTLARARDVLFNWVSRCDGLQVLDLFAGTGILGVQALSLGAKHVDFVDKNIEFQKLFHAQMKKLALHDKYRYHPTEVESFLDRQHDKSYDLVFLDPPFYQNLLTKILSDDRFRQMIHPQTIVYCEAEKEWVPPEQIKIVKHKALGDVRIYILEL